MLILAIDDSENTLALLRRAAEAMSYQFVACPPAKPAGELLGPDTPDVVMVGWHLDGQPAGSVVRSTAELYPLSPLIVMSSDQRPVVQRDAMAAGAWFFWRKGSEFELGELWPLALEERRRLESGEDDPSIDELVNMRIRRELARHRGNFSAAAQSLGMHRATLRRRFRP